jgi:hypothetical protein
VRVLFDAHLSSRRLGRPLERRGHDVLGLDQDETLGRLADEEVLALAAEQKRVAITHNIRHFAPVGRSWAERGHSHCGLILVTLPHAEYGAILRGLERSFAARPEPHEWVDRVEFLGRV